MSKPHFNIEERMKTKTNITATCKTCVFFYEKLGECRRYAARPRGYRRAPHEYGASKEDTVITLWPEVHFTDWCGEHEYSIRYG